MIIKNFSHSISLNKHCRNLTNFKKKANLLNKFFTEECTSLKSDSELLSSQEFLTRERLCLLDFRNDEILKLIRSLNFHKAHDYDDLFIRLIKICDKYLVKPLIILFQNSIKSFYYLDV